YGNLRHVLDHEGLLSLFHVVIDSREVGFDKPDARIFAAACRALGVEPRRVAHVGDSYPRDVVGARPAGPAPGWFAPGHRRPAARDDGVVRVRSLDELEASLDEVGVA